MFSESNTEKDIKEAVSNGVNLIAVIQYIPVTGEVKHGNQPSGSMKCDNWLVNLATLSLTTALLDGLS
jgi:hypothetical protein